MKKLGFGAMRLPQIEADGQRVIDMETTKKDVRRVSGRRVYLF